MVGKDWTGSMRLSLDLRVAEDWAAKHLGPSVGCPMSQGPAFPAVTRRIVLDGSDPLVEYIRKKIHESERWHESLFCFVNHDYVYDKDELARALLLHLRPNALLRTYGQRYGTQYDDSAACPKCGAGRVQRSPLVIDPRYLAKKKKDLLVTITSDEWVVSAKLANLLLELASEHCTLAPIHDLRGETMTGWFQLKVHSVFGVAVAPTRFGLDYFHPEDAEGEYVCSEHGLSGLNVLSELYVKQQDGGGSFPSLSLTKNRVGRKAGWIVPAPFLLITRSLADALEEKRIRGLRLEVAYVI